MKQKSKNRLIASLIIIGGLIYTPTFADPPGMPGSHGTNGDNPPGGSAPIGGGVFILSALGLAFGIRKQVSIKNDTLVSH